MSRLVFATCLAMASLAPAQATPSDTLSRRGTTIVVIGHGVSVALVQQALDLVDPIYARTAAELGLDRGNPPSSLAELHLHATADSYVAADLRNTGGRFARNLACALWSGSAHVAVQPPVTQDYLRHLGLPHQTLRLLAHEATHLARFQLLKGFRRHPRWFCDALAFRVSHAALRAAGQSRDLDEEPVFSESLAVAADLARAGQLLSLDGILERDSETSQDRVPGRSFYELYAQHLAFGAFLSSAGGGEAWHAVTTALTALDGAVSTQTTDATLRSALDVDEDLRRAWLAFVEGQRPQWRETSRSLASTGPDSWRQVAFPDKPARCVRARSVGAGAHELRITLRFLPATRREARILLGVRGRDAVHLVVGGYGELQLQRCSATDEKPEPLASGSLDDWPRPRLQRDPISLTVRFDSTTETVTVLDGEAQLLSGTTELPLTGAWGLSVAPGAAVDWIRAEQTR